MSGGVDSSVATALLVEGGHQVVGATMKLWGGAGDSGCCSVADVEDARRVAQQLAVPHHVFNFTEDFEARVVGPYAEDHAAGRTPNPCVECNRHLKFDRFLRRAVQLGFDAVATGHHAKVRRGREGWQLRRGADRAKDQSYVLSMLSQEQLSRVLLPVGELTKGEVRARAAALGLRTADKPDSQDVCFIASNGGRPAFLGERIALRPGRVVEAGTGRELGTVPSVELVTVGQRRGLGVAAGGERRYVVSVDVRGATVAVGSAADLLTDRADLTRLGWVGQPPAPPFEVLAQTSAHGVPVPAVYDGGGIAFTEPRRRVAPGQTVALYDGNRVLGAGLAS